MALLNLVGPFLPLLVSQNWNWWEAWLYAVLCFAFFIITRTVVARCHPDLPAERARFLEHENTYGWDRILVTFMGVGGSIIPFAAGLDARFHESPQNGLLFKMLSLSALISGFALGLSAMIENRFFSSMIRIQADRGHTPVSSGPYGRVRHPGYAGGILIYLATPVFLDSGWALLPALFLTIVLLIRTGLEDRVLRDELEGYPGYARKVRYRLLPWVW